MEKHGNTTEEEEEEEEETSKKGKTERNMKRKRKGKRKRERKRRREKKRKRKLVLLTTLLAESVGKECLSWNMVLDLSGVSNVKLAQHQMAVAQQISPFGRTIVLTSVSACSHMQ